MKIIFKKHTTNLFGFAFQIFLKNIKKIIFLFALN